MNKLTPTMMEALSAMAHLEAQSGGGMCPNAEVGLHLQANTAKALIKRGLACSARCRCGGDWAEVGLTDAGRAASQ